MTILRVAIDVPLPTLFDYRSEDATARISAIGGSFRSGKSAWSA